MDLIAVTPRLPHPGETLVGERFYTAPGGKGANQAVAAARLGAEARLVGRIGMDSFGAEQLRSLQANGVDTTGVAQDPVNPSGVAIILLDSWRQNYIVASYGANLACDGDQLEAAKEALEGADALLLQLETPLDVSLAAARYARSRGVAVVWDPAPARELGPEVYRSTDIVTPNQVEAAALTGIDVVDLPTAQEAAQALRDKGAATGVVKLGERGVSYSSAIDSGHVDAYEVDAVDTVAAGDAFCAALAVGLAEGRGLRDSIRFGAASGALAVTRAGAQEAMPHRDEVDRVLAGGWRS